MYTQIQLKHTSILRGISEAKAGLTLDLVVQKKKKADLFEWGSSNMAPKQKNAPLTCHTSGTTRAAACYSISTLYILTCSLLCKYLNNPVCDGLLISLRTWLKSLTNS